METMFTYTGYTRAGRAIEYRFSASYREKARAFLANYLHGDYSTDGGKTYFKGNSLSYTIMALRDEGFTVPSGYGSQENFFAALGFRICRARGTRWYHGGAKGLGVECDCVFEPIMTTAKPSTEVTHG